MNELHSILTNADPTTSPRGFKRVQINSSGQPVEPRLLDSILGGLRGDQVWLVRPDVPCQLNRREIELSEIAFEDTALIDVTLEVVIPTKTHREAVGKMTYEGDPVLKIVDHYREKVQQWFRNDSESSPGLCALERAARNLHTLKELAGEVGKEFLIILNAQLRINYDAFDPLATEPVLKDLHVSIPEFNIYLSDRLSHQVLLALDLSLQRNGNVSIQPPADENVWRDRLRDWIRQEARRTISANDYYGDPEHLAYCVKDIINSTIKPFGRVVRHIDARAKSLLPVPPEETVKINVDWVGNPSGRHTTFKISATMRVDPNKHQVFIARGAPAYEAWLQKHAKRILDAQLAATDFFDLTPDYVERLQANLETALTAAATQDGMQIHPFIATPEVPEIVRTRTVRFNTGKKVYQTRDGSFAVELEVSVVGSFKSLRDVISLLQVEGKLEERMKEITVGATEQVLRGAYADRYILRFDPFIDLEGREFDPPGMEGQSPNYLADTIRSKIKSELERNLGLLCKLDDIQLVQRDDRIAKLIHMILELRSFQVAIEVEPIDKVGAANRLPICVTYQVQTADSKSFLVVLRQEYEKEQLHNDIKQQITIWTQEVLSAIPHNKLRTKNIKLKTELRDQLDKAVRQESERFFGTVVKVLSIEVNRSYVEDLELDQSEMIHRLDRVDLDYQIEHIDDPDYREELRRKYVSSSSSPKQLSKNSRQTTTPAIGDSSNGDDSGNGTGRSRQDGGNL